MRYLERRWTPAATDESFEGATTVFDDPRALDGADERHSAVERRFVRLGRSRGGSVLVIAYTLRRTGDGEAIRIISARRANGEERATCAAYD